MKDDELIGRIVGFTVPYTLDPSQVDPGEPLEAERTVWGRVKGRVHPDVPHLFSVAPIHGGTGRGERYIMQPSRFHTVMPEAYEHV